MRQTRVPPASKAKPLRQPQTTARRSCLPRPPQVPPPSRQPGWQALALWVARQSGGQSGPRDLQKSSLTCGSLRSPQKHRKQCPASGAILVSDWSHVAGSLQHRWPPAAPRRRRNGERVASPPPAPRETGRLAHRPPPHSVRAQPTCPPRRRPRPSHHEERVCSDQLSPPPHTSEPPHQQLPTGEVTSQCS